MKSGVNEKVSFKFPKSTSSGNFLDHRTKFSKYSSPRIFQNHIINISNTDMDCLIGLVVQMLILAGTLIERRLILILLFLYFQGRSSIPVKFSVPANVTDLFRRSKSSLEQHKYERRDRFLDTDDDTTSSRVNVYNANIRLAGY